jgi:ribonuclease BN (tRNA processing enzyme)
VPAAIGGPIPAKNQDEIVFRWLGTANYEMAYKGHVYLLDTYYDRTPRTRSIGFTAADVKNATAIFVGHAHFDHISDIGPVAINTGATVVGAPITIQTAEQLGVPARQVVTIGLSTKTLRLPGISVDSALARHREIPQELFALNMRIYDIDLGPATDSQKEQLKAVQARGTFAPAVLTVGTLAFFFTFDQRFRVLYLDSAGAKVPRA